MPIGLGQQYSESFPTYGQSTTDPGEGYSSPSSGRNYSASQSRSTPDPEMMQRYDRQYSDALGFQQQNYSNILSGYQNALNAITGGQNSITAGYNRLGGQVQKTISGVGQAQKQEIQDTYAQNWGSAQNQMINSGLGNTTVRQSVNRGLTLDESKAQIALANQIAQLRAGYQAQIGMGSLSAREQGLGLSSGLSGQYLGVLGGQHIPFPNFPQMGSVSQGGGFGQQGGGGGQQQGGRSQSEQGGGGGYSYGQTYNGPDMYTSMAPSYGGGSLGGLVGNAAMGAGAAATSPWYGGQSLADVVSNVANSAGADAVGSGDGGD